MEKYERLFNSVLQQVLEWSTSPSFYLQGVFIFAALVISLSLTPFIRKNVSSLKTEPSIEESFYGLKFFVYKLSALILPFILMFTLAACIYISDLYVGKSSLIKVAQSLATVFFLHQLISRFIQQPFIGSLLKWVGIPIATLKIFGYLDEVTLYLDEISLQLGNITLSLLAIMRGIIFGIILFWLGRHSNKLGQKAIRNHPSLDVGTRELFAKLFEIALFIILFIVLLQVIGINLTTLAVLGGAVGVGLGFGLQQIAANFISGIIILLDRAITVGDHVELESGEFGIVRQIKMRYAVIESYEGKEIMVPNEKFITTVFTNWSHKDDKQRYQLTFNVAYDTDLHHLFDIIKSTVASHPQVLSGDDVLQEEKPDVEIDEFGDSGIQILVEYWMHGIDDGRNRVDADLKLMIWDVLKQHTIKMPLPQREVRIIGTEPLNASQP